MKKKVYPCANDVKDADVVLNDSRLSFSNSAVNRIPKHIEISHKSHLLLFFLLFALPLFLRFSSSFLLLSSPSPFPSRVME